MPRKTLVRKRRGRGVSATGGGLRRAGCGYRGGSMRHRVPASVRTKQVAQLNKIIKNGSKPGKSRASAVKRLKSWASKAHKTAQKYGLYSKAWQATRLGLNAWQANKGNTSRFGNNIPKSIHFAQDVD